MRRLISLEPEAKEICIQSAKPPLIFQIPPEEGRKRLEEAQDTPVFKYPATIKKLAFTTSEWGCVMVYCVVPEELCATPHVIYYIHGAGWVFGSFHTHEKLVRELAARTHCIVVFPEYSLSPEVRYPTAINQCYDILCQLPCVLDEVGLKASLRCLTVAGDSVGGNMATVMTILAKKQKGPKIHKQLLYYPVTDASFNTRSYCEFATDYYLYRAGMMWFWNQYAPNKREQCEITASPLRATKEDLKDLPEAMILNGEADVLRDEGQSYATKLREAGNKVTSLRFQAMIHDFVMLNALDQTQACRAAMDASVEWINRKNIEKC